MRFWSCVALLLLLSGCGSRLNNLPVLSADQFDTYQLGAGDLLQVTVFGEADLSGEYRVDDRGLVTLPVVGGVPAERRTVQQFQQALTGVLEARAVRSPQVTVQVREYRPFYILGEVQKPGSYPFVPGMTVLTAVAIGGGFSERARQDAVSITRENGTESIEARATRAARVRPGDTVFVFERHL